MPEISVWPVSSLVRTWKVGSSSARRPRATPIFSWSTFVFGSIATLMTGSGKSIISSLIGLSRRAQRVAGGDLLDADGGGDVAGRDVLEVDAFVGVHLEDAADALVRPVETLRTLRAGLELARVDAEVGELADVGVGGDLEGERRERRVVGGLARGGAALVLAADRLDALDRRHVERRRQVVDDRVEQRLHALVLERRAAEDRAST